MPQLCRNYAFTPISRFLAQFPKKFCRHTGKPPSQLRHFDRVHQNWDTRGNQLTRVSLNLRSDSSSHRRRDIFSAICRYRDELRGIPASIANSNLSPCRRKRSSYGFGVRSGSAKSSPFDTRSLRKPITSRKVVFPDAFGPTRT